MRRRLLENHSIPISLASREVSFLICRARGKISQLLQDHWYGSCSFPQVFAFLWVRQKFRKLKYFATKAAQAFGYPAKS